MAIRTASFWQYVISALLFAVMIWCGVKFMNAGHYYEQEVPFRIFCICFAVVVLVNMPLKSYLTIWSLIWMPVAYAITHFGYLNHWIPDNCNYEHVDVIRMGKLVVLLWGLMLIALLKEVITEDLFGVFLQSLRKMKLPRKILILLACLYVIVLTVMNPGYYYVIVFTVGFPVFFILCRKEDVRRRLWKAFMDGSLLAFIIISYKALRHRPYDTERYLLYFANENMAGMYLSTVAAMMSVRLYGDWHSPWQGKAGVWRILRLVADHILMGWALVLIAFNYTRTYILGLLFSAGIFFVICMIRSSRKGKVLLHFLLPVICLVVMFYPGYLIIRYVPAWSDEPVFFAGEYDNETLVKKGYPVDSPAYTSLDRFLTLAFGKWGVKIAFDKSYAGVEEGEAGGEEAAVSIDEDRDVTNGRTYVWGLFLSNMTFAGHYPGHIITEEGKLIYHAHNTYFQNTYQYGMPSGLLFTVIILGSYGYGAWMLLFKRHKKKKGHGNAAALEKQMHIYGVLMLGIILVGMLTEWSGHPCYPYGPALMMSLMCLFYV